MSFKSNRNSEVNPLDAESLDEYQAWLETIPALTRETEKAIRNQIRLGISASEEPDKNLDSHLKRKLQQAEKAKMLLVEYHLALAVKTAKKFEGKGIQLFDLIQEANLALRLAAQAFDVDAEYRFAPYATEWIKILLARLTAYQGKVVPVSENALEASMKIRDAKEVLSRKLGREPLTSELAEHMGISLKTLNAAITVSMNPKSMNEEVVLEGDSFQLQELMSSENKKDPYAEYEVESLHQKLEEALHRLHPREQVVISMRFGLNGTDPKTLDEIGEALEVTRERVRQIQSKAMSKLQDPRYFQALIDFLD